MIRILFFVAVILALGLSFAWLADRPGEMILVWQGQRVETSLLVGLTALVILLAAIVFVLWFVRTIVSSPDTARRFMRNRRRDRGYQALSQGLIAAGAGDAKLARRMTQRSRSLLKPEREPLIHVLEAQTYMIEGRHDDARAKFEAMADNSQTRALGLRGLYLEARRMGADEAAQHYAERAVEKAPQLPWAGQAALEYRTRDGKWDDAIRLVDKQRSARLIDKAEADRKRAVLLTARARSEMDGDPRRAATDAQEAFRLAPGFVPAAVTAAKALYRLNDLRRGSRLLEKIWKTHPHPEIADTYVRARIGDSVKDRLKRARKLEALKPNHVETLRIVAQTALDAHDYKLARESCEAALRQKPREGYFMLMADIEEADTGDQGRVRHWMAQALRAERDPAWTADGYVAEEWAPVSPVTGALDAFVWKVPVEQIAGPQIEGAKVSGPDADEAIRSLPPVAETKPEVKTATVPPTSPTPAKATMAETAPPAAKPVEKETPAAPKERPQAPSAMVVEPAPPTPAPQAQRPKPVAEEAKPREPATVIPLPKPSAQEKPVERSGGSAVAVSSGKDDSRVETPPKPSAGAPVGNDVDEEERLLRQRIDNPGVREDEPAAKPAGTKFRLF